DDGRRGQAPEERRPGARHHPHHAPPDHVGHHAVGRGAPPRARRSAGGAVLRRLSPARRRGNDPDRQEKAGESRFPAVQGGDLERALRRHLSRAQPHRLARDRLEAAGDRARGLCGGLLPPPLDQRRRAPVGVSAAAAALPAGGGVCIAFATSRAHSTKRSTDGLSVRFFSVTISAGGCGIGTSSGSSFSAWKPRLKRRIETGSTATKRPLIPRMLRTWTEKVVMLTGG